MKSFARKFFVTVVILTLCVAVVTPASALNLPGQGEFWNWFENQTGTSPSTAPTATPMPTPEPTPEPTPSPEPSAEPTPKPTDPPAEPSAVATEPVTVTPEATQPATTTTIVVDNSQTYNDNRTYYGTETVEETEQGANANAEPATFLDLLKQDWVIRWQLFRYGLPFYAILLVYALYRWLTDKKRR